MTDMEAEQQKARKKAQALDGIDLLAEVAKDLWVLLVKQLALMFFFGKILYFVNFNFDIIPLMSKLKIVRV